MKDEADGRNQLWKDADLRHAEVGRPDTMSDETFGFEVRVMSLRDKMSLPDGTTEVLEHIPSEFDMIYTLDRSS